ncbi:LytR/AlgR family response regulator transcription factor [Spirosoma fluviale]|uniref:Two component transcriptional regulator, LytTR family n=1 Tax=Spirosoma fluviale TaxID=1597977 RepID=A0A286GU89_9BACT|nr:LytTR family DNA-binding domain-containing protein [Spirosoma fluviale]SOD99137.1 two component transcriptional regulator, LytTR family [Spirosoma fluviale]
MINCLIVDDEQAAINVITYYIKEVPYLNLVAGTTSVMDAVELLKTHSIDLVFLDIQMPLLTGLKFIDLYGDQVKVILTTAYNEYAIDAFDRNVIDYLLKPVPFERFLKASEKALNYFNHKKSEISVVPEADKSETDFIIVKTERKGKMLKINFSEVAYIEGLKNYVSIYTDKHDRIVTYSGIGEIESHLPSHLFARVHRSYIVSIPKIVGIDGNEILMKGSPRIPTSGKYKENLLDLFQKFALQNR